MNQHRLPHLDDPQETEELSIMQPTGLRKMLIQETQTSMEQKQVNNPTPYHITCLWTVSQFYLSPLRPMRCLQVFWQLSKFFLLHMHQHGAQLLQHRSNAEGPTTIKTKTSICHTAHL